LFSWLLRPSAVEKLIAVSGRRLHRAILTAPPTGAGGGGRANSRSLSWPG
jgi:hypothetical protein